MQPAGRINRLDIWSKGGLLSIDHDGSAWRDDRVGGL